MKTFIVLIGSILFLAACASRENGPNRVQRSAIQGIWWSPQMFQSAAFQIKDSMIYYPDDFKEYRYDLSGDTIVIYQDDGYVLKSVVLRATKDTLILITQGMEGIYTRAETPVP